MSYHGVKFKTVFLDDIAPSDTQIDKLKYWCRIFHEKNLAPPYEGGSFGNLSYRLGDSNSFIITGSKIGLKDNLLDEHFVRVESYDRKKYILNVRGVREPSSESFLHSAIYTNRKDINAIFHGHCPAILAQAEKLGLISTKREEPYGTSELVDSVLEILGENNFVIMKNHGFLSLGPTPDEAGEVTIKILKLFFN